MAFCQSKPQNIAHFRRYVDLAGKLIRRVQNNGSGVDVALINLCVNGDTDRSPLPRNTVAATRVPGWITPFGGDILEVFHLIRANLKRQIATGHVEWSA